MNKNDIPYGVGVLVAKDGKFLCGLRKDTGEICGPGGHLEKDESPEQAAVRETREEFGITPKNLQPIGCLQSKTNEYLPTMVFLCTDFEGEPKTDSDEMVAPYFGFNDIADLERKDAKLYPAFEDSLSLLEDCINGHADGGPGSGFFGHEGRPGQRGGSSGGSGTGPSSNKTYAYTNGSSKGNKTGSNEKTQRNEKPKVGYVHSKNANAQGSENSGNEIGYKNYKNISGNGDKYTWANGRNPLDHGIIGGNNDKTQSELWQLERNKKLGIKTGPQYSHNPSAAKGTGEFLENYRKGTRYNSANHDGGPGSGNWGHAGRPGLRGGSGGGGGSANRLSTRGGGYTSEAKAWAENKKKGKNAASKANTTLGQKVKTVSELKKGDSIKFESKDFDGTTKWNAKVTEVADDHVIAKTDDGVSLWIDNDTFDSNISVTKQTVASNKSEAGNTGKRQLADGYGKTEAYDIANEKKDNSAKKYIDENGNLSKERDALHTKIMDDVFFDNNDSNEKDRPLGKDGKPIGPATPVEGQARLVFMGGGPASGKSSVVQSGDVDVPDNRVQIDPDRAKKAIPEYQKMVAAGDIDNAAGYAHEESSALAKRAYEAAAKNNMNVCYDGTGDGSVRSVEKKLETARKNGMKVDGVYVTCSTEEAIRRSDARAAKTGRKVNHDTIRDTHRKVSQILPQVADKFDTVSLYDTGQGGKPVLIATGGNGKGLTAVKGQEKAFQAFLDKANE